jgi:hypothetical protein
MVAVAILLTGAILGAIGVRYWTGRGDLAAPAAFEKRLEIVTPPTEEPASFAVSPDGTRLVFVATNEGKSRLWLRPLDSTVARPLEGTEGATFPFWSPDGRAVAFFADYSLKRIDLEPGSVQVLAHADGGRGGSWGPDGTIVFQPRATASFGNLVRVAATGGEVTPYESLTGYFPQFLPDGRHFLYWGMCATTIESKRPSHNVCVAALDGWAQRLLEADGSAVYSSDHLLFTRGDTLVAQRFDPVTITLSGSASPVAGDVRGLFVGRCRSPRRPALCRVRFFRSSARQQQPHPHLAARPHARRCGETHVGSFT